MNVIYSHPKSAFQNIFGVSRRESLAFSAIIALLGMAIYSSLQQIASIRTGEKVAQGISPLETIVLIATVALLYIGGRAIATPIVRRHNEQMNEQIDAARAAVHEKTGVEIDELEMPHLIEVAVKVEPVVHKEDADGSEYTITFSGEGDNLTISYTAATKRKTAPASARLAMGGIG